MSRDEIIARNPVLDYCHARGWQMRRAGAEWSCRCPLHDEDTPSFFVNPEKQTWYCHGCKRGGSIIELHAAVNNLTVDEARVDLGGDDRTRTRKNKPKEIASYRYTDENGIAIFEVVRLAGKKFKQFRVDHLGDRIWKGGMKGVRYVIFNLPAVLRSDVVFIVEGEKDCQTLEKIGLVATCNPGGAGKWNGEWKSEFSRPLSRKTVFIIPDNDDVGRSHANEVANAIVDLAAHVAIIDLPDGAGKDISDFAAHHGERFADEFAELVKTAREFVPPPPPPVGSTEEQEEETYATLPRPCYRVYTKPWEHAGKKFPLGTWLHDRTMDKRTGAPVDNDYRLCGPLEIIAKTSTADLEHGRLVEFVTSNWSTKKHILPMRLFAGRGDEALGELLSLGLETVRRHHSDILVYIQESRPTERWDAALSTGWQDDDVFVLPDEIITPPGSDHKIWYGGRDSESPYRRAGSFQQWKDGVAADAIGNPNLIGAISAAFAGPLLYQFGIPGALVHLFGPSSSGKTTTIAAGASVWGSGSPDARNAFIRSWQSTAVGVEAIASLHSDTLAVLDELHLVDPKVLDPAIYAFGCGHGKNRGNIHAGLRPTKRWRVMGLSSGEMSSSVWLRSAGYHVRSGQSVRMIDVPVLGNHGAFDDLHECKSGRQFSERIARNVGKHYGHAGPAFVRALIKENPDLDEHLADALAKFDHKDNPVQARVARIFAILAVAGELARHYGIVPWQEEEGAAINACVTLFNRWKDQLKISGADTPEAKICTLVATFISRFAESRFSDIKGSQPDDPPQLRVYDRAGWWEDIAGGARIYLIPGETLKDACKGHDVTEIAKALDAVGALYVKQGPGHLSKRRRTPNGTNEWLYYVNPDKLER